MDLKTEFPPQEEEEEVPVYPWAESGLRRFVERHRDNPEWIVRTLWLLPSTVGPLEPCAEEKASAREIEECLATVWPRLTNYQRLRLSERWFGGGTFHPLFKGAASIGPTIGREVERRRNRPEPPPPPLLRHGPLPK